MMETHDAPAGFCGKRALRQPAAGGAAAIFRSRHVRDGRDPVAVVGRAPRDRADRRSLGACRPLVRHAARAQRAVAASVHRPRGASCARDRRGAGGSLSRDFRPQADGRARRPLSRRHRGPLRRGLSRRGRVQPSAGHRAESRGSRGERDRGAARGGALQLREPRDFFRRVVARYRWGSARLPRRRTHRPTAIRSR